MRKGGVCHPSVGLRIGQSNGRIGWAKSNSRDDSRHARVVCDCLQLGNSLLLSQILGLMNTLRISLVWVALGGIAVAGLAGYTGYRIGIKDKPSEPELAAVEPPDVVPAKQAPVVKVSDDEIDALLDEVLAEPEPEPQFDAAEMEARRARWENMTIEQRRMMRRSMFAALSKVEGLEEVGDAIREGKIDPRQFNLDPESIADRMEFFADTMDQESMEQEVTKTLQDVVDQARQQMGR